MREVSAQRRNILRLYDEGLSAAQIARTLGVTRTAICHHLHAEGLRGKQYGYVKEITPWQDAVLLGTMLGDGRLCRGKSHHNAQLKLGHGPSQLSYMLWKKEQLSSFFTESVTPYHRVTKEGYDTYEIRSRSHPILTDYLMLFYPVGPKIISQKILDRVSQHEFYALIMAVWYMDDGHLSSDCANFAIGNLDDEQYQRIFDWLALEGWEGVPKKQSTNCWVYTFRSSVSLRFAELIASYMHKDLLYKLPSNRPRRKMRR
jgi:hypothetical protein